MKKIELIFLIFITMASVFAANRGMNRGSWQNGGEDRGADRDQGAGEIPAVLCTLTIATSTGGTVAPSGAQSDTCGDNLTIIATASAGYRFLRWTRSGTTAVVTDSTNDTTTVHRTDSAAGTITITADFLPIYTLTVNSVGGTVVLDPAGGTYDSATMVEATSTPNQCVVFSSWSGDTTSAVNPITIPMTANKTITANYVDADSLTITSSAGLNGSIAPDGATNVKCGTDQGYKITADPGYIIDDVLVDASSQGSIDTFTFSTVLANHTIEASFRATPAHLQAITSASIINDSTGSTIQMVIDSIDSTSNFNYGFSTWNTPTASTPYLTVKTPGFNTSGAPIWRTRTVYLTHTMRKTYPLEAQDSTAQSGDDFVVNAWLSDLITSKDTVRLNVPKAWFISGVDSNDVCSNLIVTNSSAVPPNKIIGNWSLRNDYTRVVDSIDLRCHVIHRSADSGKLVAAVKFTVADDHGDTVTTWKTSPTRTITDVTGLCIIEYTAMVPTTVFTALDTITCNFMAFPREGDSAACLNTVGGDGRPRSASPIYFVCDKNSTYGVTVAVVGDTTGQGGAGAAIDSATFDPETPPNMYNQMYLAVNAISAYNNTNHSRNNASGGVVYLRAGSYAYTGGAITAGTFNNFAYLTIRPFPGVSRDSVIIDTAINTKAAQLKVKFVGLTINKNKAGGLFDGHRNILFDSCVLMGDSVAAFIKDTSMVFNRCLIKSFGSGLYPYTGVANPILVRDCIFRGFKQKTFPFMMIGCARDSLVANTDIFITADIAIPGTLDTLDNFTIAYNDFKFLSSGTKKSIDLGNTNYWHTGGAIIQNIFEGVDSVPATYWGLCDGSSAGTVNNRLIIIHNTMPRARTNTAYNDAGPAVHWRAQWYMYGNTWAKLACKQDQFAPPSGNRVGGWGVLNGAGMSCNYWPEIKDQPGTLTFLLEFAGINSYQESAAASAISTYNWVGDSCHSYTGDSLSAGVGGGNYHPTDSSPVLDRSLRLVLPYDLYGFPREYGGALGATEDTTSLNIYVRDGGTGDGTAWDNALGQVPDVIPRGTTVWVADGSYNTYECNDPVDGTKYNTIKKATVAAHGTSVGWADSYGDGIAYIKDQFYVTTSYWVIDGVVGGGPDAWADSTSYGFRIHHDDTTTAWKLFRIATGANNIKLRHTMLIYTANSDETDSTYSESQDAYYCLGSDSSEISYCSFWYAGRCHMLTRSFDNALIEHNYFHYNKTCLRQHAQSIDDHGGSDDWTFRYNVIRKNMGTGIIVVLDDGAENCDTSNRWNIYGNIFWGGERAEYDVTDGPIVVINNKFANEWKIYNNTFININGQGTFGNRFFEAQCTDCGHEIRNNLWVGAQDSVTWGWSTGDVNSVITHEYFETGTRHKAVTSEQVAPDTIQNYATYNFSLTIPTSAGYTLSFPYNVDLYGNIRGADAGWDRGAIEYEGGPLEQYTLTLAATNGSTVPATGDTTVDSGSVITIAATPDAGYVFSHWTDTGSVVYNVDSTTATINGNVLLTAVFAVKQFTLIMNANVHSTTIPPNGDTLVDSGGVVTISCTTDAGYTFTGWEVVSGELDLGVDSTTVVVNGDGTLKAGLVKFEITEQPKDTAIMAGDAFNIFVSATGLNLTYKWQKQICTCSSGGLLCGEWVDFDGETDSIISITAADSMNYDSVRCIVADDSYSDTSNAAHITVISNMAITGDTTLYCNLVTDTASWETDGLSVTIDAGITWTVAVMVGIGGTTEAPDTIQGAGAGATLDLTGNQTVTWADPVYVKDMALAAGDTVTLTTGIDGGGNTGAWIFPSSGGDVSNPRSRVMGRLRNADLRIPLTQ